MQQIYRKAILLLTTMRGYVFAATVGIAAMVFLGATLASSLLYEKLFGENARETAQEISWQNYGILTRSLETGATHAQVEALSEATKNAFSNITRLDVYRSAELANRYGVVNLPPAPAEVLKAMASGQKVVSEDEQGVRFAYPVKAQQSCIGCHSEARVGDVLGVVASQYHLEPVTPKVRIYYVGLFLLLGTLVLLVATAISAFAAGRIKVSADRFRHKVGTINSVKDFHRLDIDSVNFGFEEFNETFGHVHELVEKIRQVAVDKNVLEFEIRLLEKFIITSNVVKDWREFICSLLIEITPIIDAYALVTIFRIEEEAYECEVFWRNTPSDKTRDVFEHFLHKHLEGNPMLHGSVLLNVVHNIADQKSMLADLSEHELELQTKSLVLDTPRIGGIVGIGVQSTMAQDEVRSMVIGSILTTLLNLVGSVKAIYKYTKDLEYYATRDPLTNIYNQRMFWELLGYEVGRSKRHGQHFAVMMLDLDNFKTINDRFGHQFGDLFLQAFSDILHSVVRDGDLLARYGGDEFCIILPEANDTQAHMIAQRIVERLEAYVMPTPDGLRVKTTTSVGIAVYPQHGEDPKDLFLVADNMMYKAKRSGKNAIAIPNEDEMAEVFRQAGEKILMVQNALDQRRIVPFFQPICNAANGEIRIHELLMRIQMDDRLIVANDFIEEAESMGIVHKMDYQLIEKAFEQMREQNYQGMLFVNLSPKALIVGEFVGRVQRLAKEFDVAPERIVFEITERETVSNLSLLEKFVLDIKMQGFSFAIDDFGSGYSSFQYIKRFPVDYIKIEGEFIRNMLQDEVYLAFIKSIVTLAKELKVKTIAEFVEDADILAAVSELGIDYAQGYHISRPSQQLYPSAN
jgi:diguanylate cyclase (GGDEF)-like protein